MFSSIHVSNLQSNILSRPSQLLLTCHMTPLAHFLIPRLSLEIYDAEKCMLKSSQTHLENDIMLER